MTNCNSRCNLQVDDVKPIIRKSKSLLSKVRQWSPFAPSSEDSGHVFVNLSLRLNAFNALLCDSEQEFLNISLKNIEMDTVFHPGSKMIVRTFIRDVLVEDVTQLSLFPKVILPTILTSLDLSYSFGLVPITRVFTFFLFFK